MKKFKPSALSLALMLGGVTIASMPTFSNEEVEEKAKAEAEEAEAALQVLNKSPLCIWMG